MKNRRKVFAKPQKICYKKNGEVTKKWENYAVDQFIGRDFFRSIKSFFNFNIYMQKDNNNLFEKTKKKDLLGLSSFLYFKLAYSFITSLILVKIKFYST